MTHGQASVSSVYAAPPFPAPQAGDWGGATIGTLHAPLDFIGINLYTRSIVPYDPQEPNLGGREAPVDGGERAEFGWGGCPEAIHDGIMRIWGDYNLPSYISENGGS